MDTCPSSEEIAAFLDGMLSPEDRERITAHLASCESCYEVFAGAAEFQEHELEEDTEELEDVIQGPFGGETDRTGVSRPPMVAPEKVRPRAPRWLALAASILVIPALGFLAWRAFQTEPRIVLADVAQLLEEDSRIPALLFDRRDYRSGEEDSLGQRSWFMAGVHILDLRLSLEAEEPARTAEILQDLAARLGEIPMMDSLSQQFSEDSVSLKERPRELRTLIPALQQRERETEETLSAVEILDFPFGLWTEAGRLAALTRSLEFFEDQTNRRFLNRLFDETPWAGDDLLEDVPTDLQTIQEIWDAGELTDAEYDTLATHFESIIRAYDTPDDL